MVQASHPEASSCNAHSTDAQIMQYSDLLVLGQSFDLLYHG
jgi:hypothetical protein